MVYAEDGIIFLSKGAELILNPVSGLLAMVFFVALFICDLEKGKIFQVNQDTLERILSLFHHVS